MSTPDKKHWFAGMLEGLKQGAAATPDAEPAPVSAPASDLPASITNPLTTPGAGAAGGHPRIDEFRRKLAAERASYQAARTAPASDLPASITDPLTTPGAGAAGGHPHIDEFRRKLAAERADFAARGGMAGYQRRQQLAELQRNLDTIYNLTGPSMFPQFSPPAQNAGFLGLIKAPK